VLAAALLFAGSASGRTIPKAERHISIGMIATRTAATATTRRAIGPATRTVVNVSFNGRSPQDCWSDSSLQLECGWRGVLVIVTARRGAGPASVRAVSLRSDPVRVFVRFSW